MKMLRISCVFGGFLSLILSMPAQTFTTLHSFDNADGADPVAPLVQATNGNLYGTTFGYWNPQTSNLGTVFKITPSGKLTTLYSLGGTAGNNPAAGLAQDTNGNLYGTTVGINNCNFGYCAASTIFKITLAGKLTTLYTFCPQHNCTDGYFPYAGLVRATNGNLYGTTANEGRGSGCSLGAECGTVFKITSSGKLTTLYSFCSQNGCADGYNPVAALIQAASGDLYGTTAGGANSDGTVFKMTPSGTLRTLHNFDGADGATPVAPLVEAADGDLYATTFVGGANGGGTLFKITPSGTLTTLYSFCSQGGSNCTDGANPTGGLIQATDGDLYGTASVGGANGGWTVFKITASGTLTTLYSFCSQTNCADGSNPAAGLVQDTDGTFYGTTEYGGSNDNCGDIRHPVPCGTVFSLSVGLGPFVETEPTSGRVGAAVKILGTNLTGATSVTFNGTAAKFTVVSKSEIKTTVPNGATTGKVKVTIPTGTLKSNVVFRVTK